MLDGLSELEDVVTLQNVPVVGIVLALIGAVFLSFGTQFQHRGVAKLERLGGSSAPGLSLKQILALVGRPSWLAGTLIIGLAIALQLTSLTFASLIVVQPIGAVALVITALLNSRLSRTRLRKRTIRAVTLCVGGIALFVTFAAIFAVDRPVSDGSLLVILGLLLGLLALWGVVLLLRRGRPMPPVASIIAAGSLYGFVATLAKVIITRIQQGDFEWLTVLCGVGLLAAGALGAYFVQQAYSSGPPDLVVAGLTVVDPMVAVGIGIVVLGEASQAPLYAIVAFIVAGAVAVYGVFDLAKHHPQIRR